MDLTSAKNIKAILKKHQLRPSKGLGQNFLVDKIVLKKIIETADIKENDIILEIGPGLGGLTKELAKKAKKIIAVEKDPKMSEILKETLKDCKNVEIVFGDILKIENCELFKNSYKVVANLPYYITSPAIRKFLETKNQPKEMILMVQKEVAQRVCSAPPKMNLLAVSVQFYAQAKIISYVSKKSFWPEPKIDSAILQIKPLSKTNEKQINADLFFKLVKAGFSQPRKQLLNNLSTKLKTDKNKTRDWLLKNRISPSQRAETLSIKDWQNLVSDFKTKL